MKTKKTIVMIWFTILMTVSIGCTSDSSKLSNDKSTDSIAVDNSNKSTTNSVNNRVNSVLYQVPGMDEVQIKKDVTYKIDGDRELKLDVYYPLDNTSLANPVIFVHGRTTDISPKDSSYIVSWAKLAAVSGLPVITFNWRSYEKTDEGYGNGKDIEDLVNFIRNNNNATELSIDASELSVFLWSAGVEPGIKALWKSDLGPIKKIVAYYGMIPPSILENPSTNVPDFFIVNANRDLLFPPKINSDFVDRADDLEWDIEYIIHPTAGHGFEYNSDDGDTHRIIEQTLSFLKSE